MNEREQAKRSIKQAVDALEQRLQATSSSSVKTSISHEQLRKMLNALHLLLEDLQSQRLSYDDIGMGRVIADTWPVDDPLGALILDAEQKYINALKKQTE